MPSVNFVDILYRLLLEFGFVAVQKRFIRDLPPRICLSFLEDLQVMWPVEMTSV